MVSVTPIRNDPVIQECVRVINKNQSYLDRQFREEMEGSLFLAAMLIEDAAKKMMERLNDLRYRNPARKT